MDYAKTASDLLKQLGGEKNITFFSHCMTRLRLVLKDENIVDDEKVKNIKGVMGVMKKGGQYQVVIGNDVAICFREFSKLGNFGSNLKVEEKTKEKFTLKGWGNSILNTISGSMTPIMPAIIGCGMVKLVVVILDLLGVSNELMTYQILTAIGDAGFYFMPLLLAYSASKKMNCSTVLALTIVGVMIHPTIVGILDAGGATFLTIPVTSATYASSVIPALLSVWFLSKAEPLADKYCRGWLHIVVKPLVLLLICVPVTLIILAPIGTWIGTGMALGLNWMQVKAGWLTLGLYSAMMPLVIMSGMHYAVVPYVLNNLATVGYDTLQLPAMLASNLGQAAACAAVAIRTKNKDLKAVASASAISAATAGITEPALYGVTMKLKKPLVASMIGSGIAGVFIGFVGLKSYAFVAPSFLAMPMFISSEYVMNFVFACIAAVISIVVTFVITLALGWDDKVDEDNIIEESPVTKDNSVTEDNSVAEDNSKALETSSQLFIATPLEGEVVPLSEVNDATFASGVLGYGIAIKPSKGVVYAPFDGTIQAFFPTLHALGLVDDQKGVELLIHVGLETVNLNGEGFYAKAKQGDSFKKGDVLLEFDLEKLQNKGFDMITPIIVTNADTYKIVENSKNKVVTKNNNIMEVE